MKLKPMQKVDYTYVCVNTHRCDEVRTGDDLAKLHRAQGYAGIAVHYVIDQAGQLYKGRDLTEPGALAKCLNKRAWQVCVLGRPGYYSSYVFSHEQVRALRELLYTLNKPVVYSADYSEERFE